MPARKTAAATKPKPSAAVRSSKPAARATTAGDGATKDFGEIERRLVALMRKHQGPLLEGAAWGGIGLHARQNLSRDRPFYLVWVKRGKAYVSLHLMPLYMQPALERLVPPELRARKQGKACFNFTRLDGALERSVATLIERVLAAMTPARIEAIVAETVDRDAAVKSAARARAGAKRRRPAS